MHFMLTQDEYDRLVPKAELDEANAALKQAREMILAASKYKCRHDTSPRHGYCDDCPISRLDNRQTSKLICPLSRHYSQ